MMYFFHPLSLFPLFSHFAHGWNLQLWAQIAAHWGVGVQEAPPAPIAPNSWSPNFLAKAFTPFPEEMKFFSSDSPPPPHQPAKSREKGKMEKKTHVFPFTKDVLVQP